MWKTTGITALIFTALIALSGCDSPQTDTGIKTNSIEIVDIQPPVNKPLTADQRVVTAARLAYDLESKAATVTLAVLRPEGKGIGSKTLASTFTVIQRGKGEVVLKVKYTVPPNIETLRVHVVLSPQQRSDSAPVVKRTYKIAR